MLGKTAGGIYWMFRLLERNENTARLVEAGFRIALTRSQSPVSEWKSVIKTAGVETYYEIKYGTYDATNVIDFLLRDTSNPSSVMSTIENARTNARMVRTALTTEVWEAVNESWMTLKTLLNRPIQETELPTILGTIRRNCALVRGSMHGTMLRNEIFDFAALGIALERADNTARIINVKYHTFIPSTDFFGSSLDDIHWETILRSVSGYRSFGWANDNEMSASSIAEYLILDPRFPRSLKFCYTTLIQNLDNLSQNCTAVENCQIKANAVFTHLESNSIKSIFKYGLHPFMKDFIKETNELGSQIELNYQFYH